MILGTAEILQEQGQIEDLAPIWNLVYIIFHFQTYIREVVKIYLKVLPWILSRNYVRKLILAPQSYLRGHSDGNTQTNIGRSSLDFRSLIAPETLMALPTA